MPYRLCARRCSADSWISQADSFLPGASSGGDGPQQLNSWDACNGPPLIEALKDMPCMPASTSSWSSLSLQAGRPRFRFVFWFLERRRQRIHRAARPVHLRFLYLVAHRGAGVLPRSIASSRFVFWERRRRAAINATICKQQQQPPPGLLQIVRSASSLSHTHTTSSHHHSSSPGKGNSCCAKTKMLWGVLFQFMWAVVSLVVTALVACWAK
jgi:hypothetical protein